MMIAQRRDGLLGSWFLYQRHFPVEADSGSGRPTDLLTEAASQIQAYLAGELSDFDLPLAQQGTAFQRAVWEYLRSIPYGQSASYGQIARALGRPSAARAVGLAVGRNPWALIVPCHRVIGSNGALTGYAG
ncbi:methylated-DNA--[protein]-cysteine S-methyltransferase, partial [Wenzhouxiangella sp. C33]|nr:methylated-DNA--[protein]-cysteine S-methyltransferase [Wenzhouxiangella limi]